MRAIINFINKTRYTSKNNHWDVFDDKLYFRGNHLASWEGAHIRVKKLIQIYPFIFKYLCKAYYDKMNIPMKSFVIDSYYEEAVRWDEFIEKKQVNKYYYGGRKITQGQHLLPFEYRDSLLATDEIHGILSRAGIYDKVCYDAEISYLRRGIKDANKISFIPFSRVPSGDIGTGELLENTDEPVSKLRQEAKPIRILKKLLVVDDRHADMFLERFLVKDLSFEIIDKDQIAKIYSIAKYKRGHTLGSSCMQGKPREWFDLYASDKCKMVIAKEKDEIGGGHILLGRALVWEAHSNDIGDFTFMDRIYTNNYIYEGQFKRFAQEQGWWYKEHQNFNTQHEFCDPEGNPCRLSVTVTSPAFRGLDFFPYLDTLQYMDKDECEISNDIRENDSYYELRETDGSRESHNIEDEAVYSEWHGHDILRSEAVDTPFGYVYHDYTVEVHRPNGVETWPREHTDIVWSVRNQVYYCSSDDDVVLARVTIDGSSQDFMLSDEAVHIGNDWYSDNLEVNLHDGTICSIADAVPIGDDRWAHVSDARLENNEWVLINQTT